MRRAQLTRQFLPLLGLLLYLGTPRMSLAQGVCTNTQVGSSNFYCVHKGNATFSGNSVSIALTNHAANSILILGTFANDTNGSVTFTISCTSTYSFSVAYGPQRRSGNDQWEELFYFVVSGAGYSGTDTCVVGDSAGTFIGASIAEYTGEATSSPLDGAGTAGTNTSGSITSGAYSATTGDLAIGFGVDGSSVGPGSFWSDRTSTGSSYNLIEDQIIVGGTATATASGSGAWVIIGVAFKAAGVAASTVAGPSRIVGPTRMD